MRVVALDLTDTYRSGLSPYLAHATKVADPFHVTRLGNRMVDQVRRRVQQETLGHRGHKVDPLFRIRKLLIKGEERLDDHGREKLMAGLRVGDPFDEVLGAWMAKEAVRPSTSWTTMRTQPSCWTTPSPAVPTIPCPRSAPSVERLALAGGDPEPPSHRRFERPNGGDELLRQAGQAGRSRLHQLRALPTPGAAPRRRRAWPTPIKPPRSPQPVPTETGRAPKGCSATCSSGADDMGGDYFGYSSLMTSGTCVRLRRFLSATFGLQEVTRF